MPMIGGWLLCHPNVPVFFRNFSLDTRQFIFLFGDIPLACSSLSKAFGNLPWWFDGDLGVWFSNEGFYSVGFAAVFAVTFKTVLNVAKHLPRWNIALWIILIIDVIATIFCLIGPYDIFAKVINLYLTIITFFLRDLFH